MTALIRIASPDDADSICRIYNHYVLNSCVTFDTEVPDPALIRNQVASTLKNYPYLVCELNNAVVGYAYASTHIPRSASKWSVNVSVYIDQSVHRRGVGRALYTSLLSILRIQKFYMAYAMIETSNKPSIGLHQAIGFQFIGEASNTAFKLGAWRSLGLWQYSLQECIASPPDPVLLAYLQNDVRWPALLRAGLPLIRG